MSCHASCFLASILSHSDGAIFSSGAMTCGRSSGSRLLYTCDSCWCGLSISAAFACRITIAAYARMSRPAFASLSVYVSFCSFLIAVGTESLNLSMRCFAHSYTPSGAKRKANLVVSSSSSVYHRCAPPRRHDCKFALTMLSRPWSELN